MRGLTIFTALVATALRACAQGGGGLPVDKIYGVNLGSWLVLEPWMLPNEWASMGGETCSGSCANCASSEFDLVRKLGQNEADRVFAKHWETWFTQGDVQKIVDAGLNTVRIPIGYWIIENLVDRATEYYPRGGIKQLKRGVGQLKSAGIHILLDFHAMPGVSSPNQMFAGRCTSDVQFYTPGNFFRALQWAAVMTFISHADPAFESVFAIQAINEPTMNPNETPGYGDYLTDFTLVVRAMELALGVSCPNADLASVLNFKGPFSKIAPTLSQLAKSAAGRTGDVLTSVAPIIADVARELGIRNPLADGSTGGLPNGVNRQCLHTTYMDILWQGPSGPNPAASAVGPAMYDDHLYFNFGGVADPNPDSYLRVICNLPRVRSDTDSGNLPLVFGEWALSTNFDVSDDFLDKWADAQKLMYSQSSGWIFWSFKIEGGNRHWDYFTALEAGHFTRDPAALKNPRVCDGYRRK